MPTLPRMTTEWFRLSNADEIESPALMLSPPAVERNLRRMIATAGSPAQLWPHVKTHKLAPIVVQNRRAIGTWPITARDRRFSLPAAPTDWFA